MSYQQPPPQFHQQPFFDQPQHPPQMSPIEGFKTEFKSESVMLNSPVDSGFNSQMSSMTPEPSGFNAQQQQQRPPPGSIPQPSGYNSQQSGIMPQTGDFNAQQPNSGFSSQPSGFNSQHSGYNSQRSGFISQQSGAQTPAMSMLDNDNYGMNYDWDQQDDYSNPIYGDQPSHQNSISHMSTPYYQEGIDDNLMGDMTVMPADTQLTPINEINNNNHYDNAKQDIVQVIPLLQDEDREIVGKTLLFVNDLLKKDASKNAVIESQELIYEIFQTIYRKPHCNDLEIIKTVALVVHHISQDKDKKGIDAIFKLEGLYVLLDLLTSPCEVTQSHAVATFSTLLFYCKDNKYDACSIVLRAGGFLKIVSLLERDNVKLLTILADCIQMLTYNNPEAKKEMLRSGGTGQLMRIMSEYNNVKLLINTVRALKVLSVCEDNQIAIIQGNGIERLSSYLDGRQQSQTLILNCLLTIRNLAVNSIKLENISENSAVSLINSLHGTNETLVTVAAGCLSNLTCNNDSNKAMFCQIGGIGVLVETIQRFYNRDEIVEPGVRALKNLTSGERGIEVAQNTVFRMNLQVFIRLLEQQRQWQVVSAAIGLIRNLARCNSYSGPLREHGAIPYLVQRLKMAEQESQAVVDGIRMNDIIQGTVGTLLTLAEDLHNRTMIRSLSVVQILVRLLSSNLELIHGPAVSVIHSLAVDPEGVQMIYDTPGATRALKQLSNSQNKGIRQFAKNILHALSKLQQQFGRNNSNNHINNMSNNMSSIGGNNPPFGTSNPQNQWNGANQMHDGPNSFTRRNIDNPQWSNRMADIKDEEGFMDSLDM